MDETKTNSGAIEHDQLFSRVTARSPTLSRLSIALALLLLGTALLAPIWRVRYPPLLDYPNHLARGFVLAHLKDPAFKFQDFFEADWGLYPYLGMDVLLLALQHLFSMETSGRVLLSITVLAMPIGSWWFIRQANPGHDWLALWTLPLSYDVFFLQGFVNFQLSLAACFFTLGFWLRWKQKTKLWWLLLMLPATITYFLHPVGFGIAALVITFHVLLRRQPIRQLLLSWIPFCLGLVFYFLSREGLPLHQQILWRSWQDKALDVLSTPVHSYSDRLDIFTQIAILAAGLIAWWRNPDFRSNKPWPLVAAALFALYWMLPLGYGDGLDIDIRLLPAILILLLAAMRCGGRRHLLVLIALVVFGLRMYIVMQNFRSEQPELMAIAQGIQTIQQNARLFPMIEAGELPEDPIRHPFAHFWSYAVIYRGAFSPYLFDIRGQTPLRITYDSYTSDGFWDLDYSKQSVDWPQVQRDYDYVWAYNVPRFSTKLGIIGTLVYRGGHLSVYRLAKTAAGAGGGGDCLHAPTGRCKTSP